MTETKNPKIRFQVNFFNDFSVSTQEDNNNKLITKNEVF